MRVGIEASIDSALLDGFSGLELVRIPAEPMQDFKVDFWIASLTPATSRRQWPHLKGVQVVQGLWAGVDALRPLIPADIVLCNARGVHDAPTAEWAVTAVLAMQKNLPFYADLQRRADWAGKDKAEDIYLLSSDAKRDPDCPVLVEEAAGKTVLIVGYGSIGAAVEARLTPFGCQFLRIARSPRDGVAPVAELDTLLPKADIVILTTPLTSETRGLIDADRIGRMKRGALLVNAGRGAVVDTPALTAALTEGRIRAALDVTDPEPLPPDHPLWRAPNLLITPHIATDTPRFSARAFAFAAEQAQRFARGEKLLNIVRGEY
jgi:phosphoglycerate dehydrogenase-like enzyme